MNLIPLFIFIEPDLSGLTEMDTVDISDGDDEQVKLLHVPELMADLNCFFGIQ